MSKYIDHEGREFDTMAEMCNYWGIKVCTFISRRDNTTMTLEEILTTEKVIKNKHVKDHLGNEYTSFVQMCKHYEKDAATVRQRLDSGKSLGIALTEDVNSAKIIEVFGVKYRSIHSLHSVFNQKKNTLATRIRDRKWDIDVACIAEPDTTMGSFSTRLLGVSIDNRSYYSVTWSNKPVTVRQIVEYYRPDLLEAYDKSNPTGEYRPYRE